MTQESTVSNTAAPPLDEVLLSAKLTTPNVRSTGVVGREQLVDTAKSSDAVVVGITAPAGYGKTTFLAQWASNESRPVAYLSLDRYDDDPTRLVSLIASAFLQADPSKDSMLADLGGPGSSALGRSAPQLAAVLRASEVPFVLMLDDLQKIESNECHDVLGLVVSSIPQHSQIATASRGEQPHIPRLRVSGDVLELGISELALDFAGIHQVFAAQHVAVTQEEAALVARRTEGWPAGVYLAALAASETDSDPASFTGEDRYFADYLYQESLSRLPDRIQDFLRCTAVVDEISGPLCDALLQRSDSRQVLRKLEEASLFLVPLDRRRDWFRYHDLFREFLFAELRLHDPDLVPELHLRAADWYESEGIRAKAIDQLLNTEESERCARMIATEALEVYQAGHMSTIARWFSDLGGERIEAYPPLVVLAGDLATLQGDTASADRWLAIAERSSFDGVPIDGTVSYQSGLAIFRSMLCPDGPEKMLIDAEFAVGLQPTESGWRDGALCMSAEAHLMKGDLQAARQRFEETVTVAEIVSGTDNLLIAEAELALLDLDSEAWDESVTHAQRALAVIEEWKIPDYGVSLIALAAGARVSLHEGDMDTTNRLLAQGMRARQYCTASLPYLAVRGRLNLARVSMALADVASARHLLREIGDILHLRPKLGSLVTEVEEFRSHLATSSTAIVGRPPLTAAELRVLPYLQTHLTVPQIAERLFVSRNTIRTQVGSIYRKLGASSRAEAVEEAVGIGLLGG